MREEVEMDNKWNGEPEKCGVLGFSSPFLHFTDYPILFSVSPFIHFSLSPFSS
jgi:hypothetical protein